MFRLRKNSISFSLVFFFFSSLLLLVSFFFTREFFGMQFLWHLYTVFVYCFSSIVYFSGGFCIIHVYTAYIEENGCRQHSSYSKIHFVVFLAKGVFSAHSYSFAKMRKRISLTYFYDFQPNSCFALLIHFIYLEYFFLFALLKR